MTTRIEEFIDLCDKLADLEVARAQQEANDGEYIGATRSKHPESDHFLWLMNKWRRDYNPDVIDTTLTTWNQFLRQRIAYYDAVVHLNEP